MFSLKDDEMYCQYCNLIVPKPHDCKVLAERVARLEEREKHEPRFNPAILWNCGGSTRGFSGGPGTGMPRIENINPGASPPTLNTLGLTAEQGRELGI